MPAQQVTKQVKDAAGATIVVAFWDDGTGVLKPIQHWDADQLAGLASEETLAALLEKVIAAPSTEAKQDAAISGLAAIAGHVDGVETLLAAVLAKITADPSTGAKQDSTLAETQRVGTRTYGSAQSRVTVSNASAYSASITATEVLLHASTRCFVRVIAATGSPMINTDDIPLEAGEKFHLRITSGQRIGVIRDATDGYLNIVPVA